MTTPNTRTTTSGRIVALAFIALVVAGLGYLRSSSDAEPFSVPDGAKAGDLELTPCDYETESGRYAADCGALVVAEDATDPASLLIALPVTRIRAGSTDPGEPIFRLNGGPGQSNMDFPEASRFAENHDVVLVGYRGADGSVRLDCPEVESALQHSSDFLAEQSLRAYSDAFRSCADRLSGEGIDLPSYGLVQQVDDLEAARLALGYDRINLLSESAGTRTAMIYAWRFPQNVHRSVMFGVNPPGNMLWREEPTDNVIRRYAALCSQDTACQARTGDLATTMRKSTLPNRWLFLPIKTGNARTMTFMMVLQSNAEGGLGSAPTAFDTWLSADEGDSSGLWFQSVFADLMYPKLFVWGQYATGASIDADAARDYFASGGPEEPISLGRAATTFAWGGGGIFDGWPVARGVEEYGRVRTSEVETLLIGGELDIATPAQLATTQLLPFLPNGQEVVLSGIGHSPSFWPDQAGAGTRLITTFFDTGQVDDSLYQPQGVDFTPGMTGTSLARLIAAVMVGLALLTVLSLVWMGRRVQAKGGFGRSAGLVLRSVYPIVLGLGGLALGSLIALISMPSVHLDNPVLVVLSVGVPVALGIYWAWVHRDWPSRTRIWGFLSACGGGLLGAWWGLTAAGMPIGVFTATVGAMAAANLFLIIWDIVRDRQAAHTPRPTRPPRVPAVQATS